MPATGRPIELWANPRLLASSAADPGNRTKIWLVQGIGKRIDPSDLTYGIRAWVPERDDREFHGLRAFSGFQPNGSAMFRHPEYNKDSARWRGYQATALSPPSPERAHRSRAV